LHQKGGDFDVQELYEAKIAYKVSSYTGLGQTREKASIVQTGEAVPVEEWISDDDILSVDGFLWKNYNWNKIYNTESFLSDAEKNGLKFFDSGNEEKIKESEFVFVFKQTESLVSTNSMTGSMLQITGELVSEVTLLQFKLISNNEHYNLGVVSDIVSDDGLPDGSTPTTEDIFKDILEVLKIIAFAIILVALSSPIIKILEFILSCLKSLLKTIVSLILLPFDIINSIFKK
jgi:hypothetical protein